MKSTTKSILQELSEVGVYRDPNIILETRGMNLIQSAINLFELIHENYEPEIAEDLERKFLNSIKLRDPNKFKRNLIRKKSKWKEH